jgi:hypothetical protein
MIKKTASFAALALLASLSMAKASPLITTGTISSDSDVNASFGNVVEAFNFAASTETINGVTFIGTGNINGSFTNANGSGYTMNGPGVDGTGGGIVGSPTGGNDTNLSAGLQNLLGNGVHNGSGNLTFTITGLTVGTGYSLQLFINANTHDARSQQILDGTTYSPVVTTGGNNYTGTSGGPAFAPAYINEVFTAKTTSETLHFEIGGGAGAQFSGFALEVPEPSTWAMMAAGLVGLVFFSTRRRMASRS